MVARQPQMLQMPAVETGQMAALATEDMPAVETGPMSAAETGQMSAVETGQMHSVKTFGTCLAPDCSEHWANIGLNQPNKTKVTMLNFGDVSFDFSFE